jgi:hypothetical protein
VFVPEAQKPIIEMQRPSNKILRGSTTILTNSNTTDQIRLLEAMLEAMLEPILDRYYGHKPTAPVSTIASGSAVAFGLAVAPSPHSQVAAPGIVLSTLKEL